MIASYQEIEDSGVVMNKSRKEHRRPYIFERFQGRKEELNGDVQTIEREIQYDDSFWKRDSEIGTPVKAIIDMIGKTTIGSSKPRKPKSLASLI